MSAQLYGIGVGVGDPELLTLRALRCIRESDVIILPAKSRETCHAYAIVRQVYPEIDEKTVSCFSFPMTKDLNEWKQAHDEVYTHIVEYLRQGKTVAFLTIGDSCVYSTYSYIYERACADGWQASYVNGIPSFCAAAARLGIPLAENKEEIHIVPASYGIEESLRWHGTKIYMKSGRSLKKLKQILLQRNDVIVYTVSNCMMEQEKIAYSAEEIEEDSGYLTLVIVKEK